MRTKKFIIAIIAAAALLIPAAGYAGVNLNIGIGLGVPVAPPPPPPPVVMPGPPEMAVIPGLSVYFVPGVQADIFFYGGSWYRRDRGYWYRSGYYNGPWRFVPRGHVPRVFYRLPRDWRRDRGERYEYGDFRRHWREWDRERERGDWHDRGEHRGWDHDHGHGRWGHGRDDD
ncbi:MAG: hypothetical protein M0018_12530 [Nitrospiraceae bacterium]|nr:hypothetical protein [Nitrospiraceae bacterium]